MERGEAPASGYQDSVAPTTPHVVTVQPQTSYLPPGVALSSGQGQTVTVITNNVTDMNNRTIINVNPGTRQWSTSLCGCFDDFGGCKFCVFCSV